MPASAEQLCANPTNPADEGFYRRNQRNGGSGPLRSAAEWPLIFTGHLSANEAARQEEKQWPNNPIAAPVSLGRRHKSASRRSLATQPAGSGGGLQNVLGNRDHC